jgi:VWFA-related protein
MSMPASSVLCLIIAVCSSLVAAPQQQPSTVPQLGETLDISIVNVDVIVTDRNGNRVRGLTRDDFELIENGSARPLSNFAEYRARTGDGRGDVVIDAFGAPVGEGTAPPPRSIVLFVDAFALPRYDADPMFAAMKKMIRDAMRAGDVASIVMWNPIAFRPDVVVGYTSDSRRLTRAIDDLHEFSTLGSRRRGITTVRGSGIVSSDVVNLNAGPRNPEARATAMRDEGITIASNVLSNRVSGAGQFSGSVRGDFTDARFFAMREFSEQRRKAGIIKALIASMASIEGRKALILATHRLSLFAGGEYFYALGYNDVPPHERAWLDTRPVMSSVIDAANAAGVTIYPIYPEGLGNEGALPNAANASAQLNGAYDYQVLTNETSALSNLAIKTGGMMAWGAKDVATLLPRINDDLNSYYSLAYRSTPASEDTRRGLTVKTKNPDYRVRARREYAATTEETKIRQRVTAAVFREPDGKPRLSVQASFGPQKKEDRNAWRAPLTLRIPMSQLVALSGEGEKRSGSMSIYIASAASLGTDAEVTHQTQPFSYPDTSSEKVASQYVTYDVDVRYDEASQFIALAVVDDVSRDMTVLRLKLPRH